MDGVTVLAEDEPAPALFLGISGPEKILQSAYCNRGNNLLHLGGRLKAAPTSLLALLLTFL